MAEKGQVEPFHLQLFDIRKRRKDTRSGHSDEIGFLGLIELLDSIPKQNTKNTRRGNLCF